MARADFLLRAVLTGVPIPDLLQEDRLGFLAGKYRGISTAHDLLGQHKTPEDIVNHFASKADPSTNKKYTDRILHWYSKGQFRQEDHPRIHQALSAFKAHSQKLAKKDIGKYDSLHELEGALEGHQAHRASQEFAATMADQQAVHYGADHSRTPNFDVHQVHTHDAMSVLGKGTQWCVVPRPDGSYADDARDNFYSYQDEGPLHHIKDKTTGKQFLFHARSGQLMDVHDHQVFDTYGEDDEIEHHVYDEPPGPDYRDYREHYHGDSHRLGTHAVELDKVIPGFARHVARHTKDHEVLDALSHDTHSDPTVRRIVASSEHTHWPTHRNLVPHIHEDPVLRHALAKAHPEVAHQVWKSVARDLAQTDVSGNRHHDALRTLEALTSSRHGLDHHTELSMIHHPNVPEGYKASLAFHSKNTEPLKVLAKSPFKQIRIRVANNKHAHHDTLKELSHEFPKSAEKALLHRLSSVQLGSEFKDATDAWQYVHNRNKGFG